MSAPVGFPTAIRMEDVFALIRKHSDERGYFTLLSVKPPYVRARKTLRRHFAGAVLAEAVPGNSGYWRLTPAGHKAVWGEWPK